MLVHNLNQYSYYFIKLNQYSYYFSKLHIIYQLEIKFSTCNITSFKINSFEII